MRKILFFIIWISSIAVLSFAYEEFLYSEFMRETVHGVVAEKGVDKTIKNTFDNFIEEKEYWIKLDEKKIIVTKAVYDELEPRMEITMNRTRHGMALD